MFCPEQYMTLYEVVIDLAYIAEERQRNKPRNEADQASYESSRNPFFSDTGQADDLEERAYREWLFSLFIRGQRDNLYACSPQGVILRLAKDATYAQRVYDGAFPEDEKGQQELVDHLKYGLDYVNSLTLQIEPNKSATDLNEFGGDIVGGMLTPLAGWNVCWKPLKKKLSNEELHQICLSVRNQAHNNTGNSGPQYAKLRGRPKRGDGIIETILKREFSRRHESGELTDVKRESVLQFAIEWLEHITGETISRSTVQRYLEPIFCEMDAQN